MGAKQRAQRKAKAARGSQKGTPASQKKLNSSMHIPDLSPAARSNALMGWQDFTDSSPPKQHRVFSMNDIARNAGRHSSGWDASKLRAQAITFVSAGTLHQDPEHIEAHVEDEKMDDEEAEQEEDVSARREPSIVLESVEIEGPLVNEETRIPITDSKPRVEPLKATTSYRPPVTRSVSNSSSDNEQIVFKGRSKGPTPRPASVAPTERPSRTQSENPELVKPSAILNHNFESQTLHIATSISGGKPILPDSTRHASPANRRIVNTRLQRRGRHQRRQSDIDDEEAIMRDYIANMAMDVSEESIGQSQNPPSQQQLLFSKPRKNETIRFYAGSGEENAKVQLSSAGKRAPRMIIDQAIDWNSDDLQDFDELSTTDEDVVDIAQVLRHRQRKSGIQYLVTPTGLSTSDSKWILHSKLVSDQAKKEIAIFEELQAMEFEDDTLDDVDEDEDGTTDEEAEEALNDLIHHIESEDDENARILKHTARMSDEEIARALAKQEELGMGGDELMIFGGDFNDKNSSDSIAEGNFDIDDEFGSNADFVPFSLKTHTSNRIRSKRNQRARDSFPSAAAFADALDQDPYGAFDVMDFDRPSLRPKRKGRKSDFPYDLQLEDEDLKAHLVSTWAKDRDKKAQRKREKEELRMNTMLEFADRNEPGAIKAEVRRFLTQEIDVLRLAPMDAATRASVHRLAKALKLNSHSEGKDGTAKGRYPVLTKTYRTPSYTIETIWEVDALLNTRKFFPKNASSYKKDKIPRGTARSMHVNRSGGISGASYMNGEIVGASAPELGIENRGRAMLEKMGWSSGMGIGAEGNKGSLEAVQHVFKTSRAGLG